MENPGRSRTIGVMACVIVLAFALAFAVTGVITFLVLQRQRADPPGVPFSHDGYAFEYPGDWTQEDLSGDDRTAGAILRIVDGDREITVYDYDSSLDAKTECMRQTDIMEAFFENPVREELEPLDVDGESAHHLRLTGMNTLEEKELIYDMYCLPRPRGVVQLVAVDASSQDREPVAEIEQILESWTWT